MSPRQSCSKITIWSHEKIDPADDLDLFGDLDQHWWSMIFDLLNLPTDLTMRSWSWSLIYELFDHKRSKIKIKDQLLHMIQPESGHIWAVLEGKHWIWSYLVQLFWKYDLDLWFFCGKRSRSKIKDQDQWSWSSIFNRSRSM